MENDKQDKNETKGRKISDLLYDHVEELIGFVKTETKANLPGYVQEMVRFSFLEALLTALFFPSLAIATTAVAWYLYKVDSASNVFVGPVTFIMGILALVVWIIALIASPCAVMELVKIKTAPKVFIVDKLKSLIKSAS